MRQKDKADTHREAALYWSAVSLMVCEGLAIEQAARRLDVEREYLQTLLERRDTHLPSDAHTEAMAPPCLDCLSLCDVS
jgi:hypothetical protein